MDIIAQIMILITGLTGQYLIARKIRVGWLIAIFGQLFWFYTTINHRQLFLVLNTVVYTGIFVYGWYNWKNKGGN